MGEGLKWQGTVGHGRECRLLRNVKGKVTKPLVGLNSFQKAFEKGVLSSRLNGPDEDLFDTREQLHYHDDGRSNPIRDANGAKCQGELGTEGYQGLAYALFAVHAQSSKVGHADQ